MGIFIDHFERGPQPGKQQNQVENKNRDSSKGIYLQRNNILDVNIIEQLQLS